MFVRLSVEDMSVVHLTGFNSCIGGYELLDEFRNQDLSDGGCLDASHFVPAGSVKRIDTSFNETRAVSSSCAGLVNARMFGI